MYVHYTTYYIASQPVVVRNAALSACEDICTKVWQSRDWNGSIQLWSKHVSWKSGDENVSKKENNYYITV